MSRLANQAIEILNPDPPQASVSPLPQILQDDKPLIPGTISPLGSNPDSSEEESSEHDSGRRSPSTQLGPTQPPIINFKFIPSESPDQISVYEFGDIKSIPILDPLATRKVRVAQDQDGRKWILKKTNQALLRQREGKKEIEIYNTAREVYFAEVGRFLDPNLPECRAGRDSEGNYYVLSEYIDFTSFDEIISGKGKLDEKLNCKELIKADKLRGAARMGIINMFIIEWDGSIRNLGVRKLKNLATTGANEHIFRYVVVQIDRGQTGSTELFMKAGLSHKPTAANIDQNPYLEVPVDGEGFAPKFWFDVISNKDAADKSEILDPEMKHDPIMREETNETLLNIALMTPAIINALGESVLGQYERKDFQKILEEQQEIMIHVGINSHQGGLNTSKECFRNFIQKKSQEKNQADTKDTVINSLEKCLTTFRVNGRPIFKDLAEEQTFKAGIASAFINLTGKAALVAAPSSAAPSNSLLKDCSDWLKACCARICCCGCCETKPSTSPSTEEAQDRKDPPPRVTLTITAPKEVLTTPRVTPGIFAANQGRPAGSTSQLLAEGGISSPSLDP